MNPHVILLTDFTDALVMTKSIGPYKVAYELRKAGYDVLVINHLHMFEYEDILNIIKHAISEKTLFVGVNNRFYKSLSKNTLLNFYKDQNKSLSGTFLPHGIDKNKEIIDTVRQINPRVKFVIGGPLAVDRECNKDFDYIVPGYADLSIVNLANHLSKFEEIKNKFKSIYGPTIINDPRAEGFDFANSTMRYADEDCILNGETLQIEISRGCIFKCAFCNYPLNGKKKFDYIKQEELLYNEFLDNFNRFNVTRYIFSDDTFNDSVEKCEMIYRISQRLPFKLEYWAFLRLDLIAAHPIEIDLLYNSGCRAYFFGIETFNNESGSIIGKGMKKEKLLSTIATIKSKYGNNVTLHGAFIFGLPKENVESMKNTIDYLTSDTCLLDSWTVAPLSIRMVKQGQLTDFDSDIDINWKKFGYSEVTTKNGSYWKNEYIDAPTALLLVEEAEQRSKLTDIRKLGGGLAIQAAGLGIDINLFFNKSRNKVNWVEVYKYKQNRFIEYRSRILKLLNMSDVKKGKNV